MCVFYSPQKSIKRPTLIRCWSARLSDQRKYSYESEFFHIFCSLSIYVVVPFLPFSGLLCSLSLYLLSSQIAESCSLVSQLDVILLPSPYFYIDRSLLFQCQHILLPFFNKAICVSKKFNQSNFFDCHARTCPSFCFWLFSQVLTSQLEFDSFIALKRSCSHKKQKEKIDMQPLKLSLPWKNIQNKPIKKKIAS